MTDTPARALAIQRWGKRQPTTCQECGSPVLPESRYRLFCSERCRVRAWRKKQRSKPLKQLSN
jgi:endogenous inhibitor of DNA gyrase (YacG/DUF329 family)